MQAKKVMYGLTGLHSIHSMDVKCLVKKNEQANLNGQPVVY